MLRDKVNFGVLEGLLTVLLEEEIKIEQILESEANQDYSDDKFNKVDIKALNSKGEIIIVEIQLTRQLHYLERILYGVSKAITEHMSLGQKYDGVRKVYSISILYFDLGKGDDYLYHGKTTFIGVHTGDKLQVSSKEKDVIRIKAPEQVFPEYYLIRVNEFNKNATTPLEEWISYLKDGEIKEETQTPGLGEAREKLQYLKMSKVERLKYDKHLEDMMVQNDVLATNRMEGEMEGRRKGREEGRREGLQEGIEVGKFEEKLSIARNMKQAGMSDDMIIGLTGLSAEEIEQLNQ
jgi:predicted transposase/invertase (TIGR01784 family)